MRHRGKVIAALIVMAVLFSAVPGRAHVVEPLPSERQPAAAVGSLTYVLGPDHLAELVSGDDLLHPRALAFARRAKVGTGVMMGGVALGAAIVVGAATMFTQNECVMPAVPEGFTLPVSPICQSHTNEAMALAGIITAVVGGVTGVLLMPSTTDGYEIVNAWNARHPERSLLVASPRRSVP
jgi:hypothetical protein